MRNMDEIIINRVVLNVLDKENNAAIFSEKEMELTESVYEYFEKHILRIIRDEEAKPAFFNDERNIVRELCKEVFEDEGVFISNSNKLSQYLFKCMQNDEKEISETWQCVCLKGRKGNLLLS